MPNFRQPEQFRIQLETKNCECSAAEIAKMERALDTLAEAVRTFPVSDLYVTIVHHPRSNVFHVKTSLVLTGRTLFTGTRHREMYTAYERCVDKLVRKVAAYKSSLGSEAELAKQQEGTRHDVIPEQIPQHEAIAAAVTEGDYPAFRKATVMYEEPVRKRIGRWIQRYPALNAVIGDRLEIADLVEGVFLTAFEEYEHKSADVPAGDWLEGLIDQEIRDLTERPEEELENISLAQSARELESD